MAPQNGKPQNGNTKPRRPGGSKLAQSSKPVPAIPLPYVKRQAAAAARASAASTASQEPDAPPSSELKLTNGTASAGVKKAGSVASAAAASSVSSPVSASASKAEKEGVETKADSLPKPKNDAAETTNSHKLSGTYKEYSKFTMCESWNTLLTQDYSISVASVSEHPTTSENKNTHKNSAVSDRADQPTTKNQAETVSRASDKTTAEVNEKSNDVLSKGETKPQSGEALRYHQDYPNAHNSNIGNSHVPKMNKSRPPPAVQPGRYQLPPAFQPSGRPLGPTANGDLRGPRPLMPNGPLHQPHPSNGSIHFGAFHGSTNSSPAPLSGGIAPPPGMPGHDGRPPYMAPGTNGFPPMMPYGAEHVPVTTFDNFARPPIAYGPMDSFPPFGNNYGPPTPHSYHDSQASGPEDVSIYNQFASGPVRNGVPGPGEDSQSPNYPGRMFGGPEYPRMMQNAGPPPMMSAMDDAEGLISYFQQQFGSPEFADCVLELQYTNRRVPPVRIPGHRILFSRSSELANAMSKGFSRSNSDVAQLPALVIETESKWIQSESFYIAVQRLYGLPLFTPPPAGLKQDAATEGGSLTDRFDFALGYAASGHLLRWDAVTRRGCELAIELLNLQTVEKALEFALEGHRDEGSHDVFKYGDGSRAILREIVSFIANNLHPNFKIDTSVTDPSNYARLPPQATLANNATTRKLSPPPIARGTSVHLGKGRRSQQISGIQFGDLSLTEGKMSPGSDASASSQQQRTPLHAILSRILLNLPFETLKALLETATREGSAWANADVVFHAVKDTVVERERRRLQLTEMVKNRLIPQWEIVSKQLSTPEPRNYIGPWGALGWQEEILPFGPSESPSLSRTWVPLTNSQPMTQAAYP
ncbi:topoisomerase ii-associated [Fusarium longipes]|uniref:Topoisomerase ii-associated n=1 Tax=Fusarium longipes TaxID=694270 RepID=A0A395RKI9_9HYPO|nr:topoisomerase ii-associated [Fusarium longipes]